MKKWRCTVCGYIHEGDSPPEKCPVCGAEKEKFTEIKKEKGKKTNLESLASKREMPSKESSLNHKQKEVKDLESENVFLKKSFTDLKEQKTADVLIAGSGAAAFAAAVTARSKGLSVIMLEKAEQTGGTTARSGGGYWIPCNRYQRESGVQDNKEDALKYMARYSYPHLYNNNKQHLGLPEREYSLLESYVDNANIMVDYFDSLGSLHSIMEINWTGKPQVDYMDHLPENKGIRGRSLYPKDTNGKLGFGTELIKQLETWSKNNGVEIITNCKVTDILKDSDGKISGLKALNNGQEKVFNAKKGIIFGSGGYSHNNEYMLQFQRGPHFGGCSVPTNTGDFITMAGRIGAKMGNMAGAFRAQSMIESAIENPSGSSNLFYLIGDSMLLVNKYGKRIMNEKRNYTDRTMLHFVWDPVKAEWTNMITFLIFDQRCATLWQGFSPFPIEEQEDQMPYIIKEQNLLELTFSIKKRLRKIKEYTGGFKLSESFLSNLFKTVITFGKYSLNGKDEEFHRGEYAYDREWTTFPPTVPNEKWPEKEDENYTIHPFSESGPYYAIILAAGTLDTNGGPVTDKYARILDWDNKPIEKLYAAGNCISSPTANAYWGAGSTIGPAMTFGYIAAKHIANNTD